MDERDGGGPEPKASGTNTNTDAAATAAPSADAAAAPSAAKSADAAAVPGAETLPAAAADAAPGTEKLANADAGAAPSGAEAAGARAAGVASVGAEGDADAKKDSAVAIAVPSSAGDTRRRVVFGALGAAALVVASIAAVAAYGSWIVRDEDRRWTAASDGGTEASWQAYVEWSDEVRSGGGLRSILATELTLIWAHAPLAADSALVSRAAEAIAREDWPALCALRVAHPGTRGENRALAALRDRFGRGAASYADRAATNLMRPRALVALRSVLGIIAEEDPCEPSGVLRIRHGVDAAGADEASRDLEHTIPGGTRTVRALLEGVARDERDRAIADAVLPELGTALGGVYGLRLESAEAAAPGTTPPHLVVELEGALHAHARFLAASRTELPGLALRTTVRFFIRRPGIETVTTPDYESVADIVLPPDAALEIASATSSDAIEAAYGRMLDELYRRATERLRMELGLSPWTSPTVSGGACDDVDPIAPGTIVRGTTGGAADITWGLCSPEAEAYEESSDCYDCDYDEYYEEPPSNPEVVYRLVVAERSRVAVAAITDDPRDIVTYVRASCSDMSSEVACGTGDAPAVGTLDPGVYYVFVDGAYGSEGRFRLAASLHDPTRPPDACRSPSALVPGVETSGSTRTGVDAMEATCGGVGAHEVAHALEVAEPSRLRCRLSSDADAIVSVRSDCADPETEVACGSGSGAGLRARVEAGRHAIVVDGYGPGEQGAYTLACDLAPADGATDVVADSCAAPGSLPTTGSIALDTFAARDDLRGSCALGDGGPDLVYRVDVAAPAHLRATPGGAALPILYLQRSCGDRASEVACAASGVLEADLETGSYYLVADGLGPTAFGAATIDVALTDLGSTCAAALPATRGPSAGTTRGSSSLFRGTCGGAGPEAIYRLTLGSRSHVVIRSQQAFLGVVYVRRDCADWRSELGCSDMDEGHDDRSLVDLTLDSGAYTIFVDGEASTNQGTFTLDVAVENAVESLH